MLKLEDKNNNEGLMMNAILFLLGEHDEARACFKSLSGTSLVEPANKLLLDQLCFDLVRHETMEEIVWYPKLMQLPKLADIIHQLKIEEKNAGNIIKKINSTGSGVELNHLFITFKKAIEHHASEEETKLFPKVLEMMTDSQLRQIGREMVSFKESYAQLRMAG